MTTLEPIDLSRLLLPIQPDDHVRPETETPFTLVEYGDYECPECGRLFSLLEEMQKEPAFKFRIAYRHYPLSGVHPNAQLAAEASEAASAQGRFWDMHDLLFRNQSALRRKHLREYAKRLELDFDRFENDLREHVYDERVRQQFKLGVQNGVYATPGLFVNGVRLLNPISSIRTRMQELINGDTNPTPSTTSVL